jgi:hypothetical protein
MTIRPLESDGRVTALLFQSIVINELSRPPIGLFDYEGMKRRLSRQRSYAIVTLCSYCGRAMRDAATDVERCWMEPEDYYRSGGPAEVQISHGICPLCYTRHVEPFIGGEEGRASDSGSESDALDL